jgi:hypothetical protein
MARVKGSTVLSRLQFLEERYGASAKQAVIASLSPEWQAVAAKGVPPHEWVPYEFYVDINVAADRLHGRGDLALCREMGRFSAERNLPTLYRIFYRLGSPLFIFRKAARVWEVHYDSGRMVPVQEGERAIRLKMVDFEKPHRAHCLSVHGWAERSAELSGATLVHSEEERCRLRGDAACEIVMLWT